MTSDKNKKNGRNLSRKNEIRSYLKILIQSQHTFKESINKELLNVPAELSKEL